MWFYTALDRIIIWSSMTVPILADLLLYSTVIGTIGLLGHYILKKKGAVYQSLFLRLSLLAILITPLAAWVISSCEVTGIRLPLESIKNPEGIRNVVRIDLPAPVSEPVPELKHAANESDFKNDIQKETPQLQDDFVLRSSDNNRVVPAGNVIAGENIAPRASTAGKNLALPNENEGKKNGRHDIILPILFVAISLVWAILSLVLLVKALLQNIYIKYLIVTAYKANPLYIKTCCALAQELNVKPPRVLQSPLVKGAFLTGFFRPTIVLPLNANETFMSSREVFIHEFAHMIRHDHLFSAACQIGKIIMPLQPLIWLISGEIEVTSEYACDDYVVVHGKTSRGYACQLYTMASLLQSDSKEMSVGVGIFPNRSYLLERIERILDKSHTRFLTMKFHEVVSFIVLFLSSVVLTGFFSFRSEAVKRHAVNQDDYSQKKNTSAPVREETVGNLHASVDSKSISSDSGSRNDNLSHGITKETPDKKNIENTGTDAALSEIKEKADLSNSSSVFDHAFKKTELPLSDHSVKTTEISAVSASVQREGTVFDKVSPVEMKGEGIYFKDTNQIVTYSAFVKSEPAELKINAGIGSNQQPLGKTTEQFTALISLTEDFQSLSALDQRARTLHYTSTRSNQLDPVWSPDGKKIAFTDGKYGVWIVPSGGGEPILVYDNYYKSRWKGIKFHSIGNMDTFCFSPDGQNLLFQYFVIDEARGTTVTVIRDSFGYISGYHMDGLVPVIMSVDIKTGAVNTVREQAEKGRYSPNGKYLGFVNYDYRYLTDPAESFHMKDLTVRNMDTGEIRYLTYGQYTIKNFCFDPDNTSVIACMTPKDGSAPVGLYRIHIRSGVAERMPVELETECCDDLQFSENGEWLVYTENKAGVPSIAYYDVLTGEQRRKTLQSATKNVSLSPDGEKICSVMETAGAEPAFRLFTSVSSAASAGLQTVAPVGFALKGNFPNPFNQSTVIEYTLPETGKVSLEIYNILGQKIRQLVSETVRPGSHAVRWDGRNDKGQTVSSGTYIMRLSMGRYVMTKNMMVIK